MIAAARLNSGEEISGKLVVTCGDGAKVLEFIEEALDEIALAVERKIASSLDVAARHRWDDRSDSPLAERVGQSISVECLIADQSVGIDAFAASRT